MVRPASSLAAFFSSLLLVAAFVSGAHAQNDSFLSSNGTFKSPMAFANTWSAAQTFNAAATFNPPVAFASGGTGDTGTAWTSFTPSPACGDGTIVTNSARQRTIGKTVFFQLDVSFTSIGTTCIMNPNRARLIFSLPATPAFSAVFAGSQIVGNANSDKALTCIASTGGGGLAGCSYYDGNATTSTGWLANDQIRIAGVYDSQ
jgi:hypothetical protein